MVRNVISSLIIGFFALISWSQENKNLPPLERSLNIKLERNTTKEALKIIEIQGGFSFAYKTTIIDSNQRFSRTYQNQTTREILDDIFQGQLSYQGKGNYIILRASPKLKELEVNVEGYVLDKVTGEKIPYATIYDTTSLTATISDEYGHFSLKLTNPSVIYLNVKKAGYLDTATRINKTGTELINFYLNPEVKKETVATTVDTANFFEKVKNMKFLKPSPERKANISNFKEQLKTKAQVSFIPTLGTNGMLSSSTVVDYSFNVIGGFNGGVRKAEIGGMFNIDVDSVRHFQAAGFLNAVGGYQSGVQLSGFSNFNNDAFKGVQSAGFINTVRKDFEGVQAAGFGNLTLGKFEGVQAAGFYNIKGDSGKVVQLSGFSNYSGKNTTGIQAAGFVNYAAKNFRGTQVAGFVNYAGKEFNGPQLAGFVNYAGNNFRGTQVAGFVNYAGVESRGPQLAGFVNFARKDFTGVQISGFLNVAKNIKGVQLGFININDTISGVPIGFFSFSKKGLHQLEISSNEFLPYQLAFKTGTKRFYNSFIGAMRTTQNANPIWSFGYGIGTSLDLSPRSSIFFDLQTYSLHKETFSETNSLNKLIVSYQFQWKKKLAIAVGPSFNVYVVQDASSQSGTEFRAIAPYQFYDKTFSSDTNVQMWVGGHVSIRIF